MEFMRFTLFFNSIFLKSSNHAFTSLTILARRSGVIVRGTYGEGNGILCRVEPTFRGRPEFALRLVANSIFFAASN
jgi:hypothetical protein